MQATFHLQASELTDEFFASLKSLVGEQPLTISLETKQQSPLQSMTNYGSLRQTEPNTNWNEDWEDNDGLDETERIRRNPALHAEIMRSLAQADAGKLIAVDMDKILVGIPPQEAIIDDKIGAER